MRGSLKPESIQEMSMDIKKVTDFLSNHNLHTMSVERKDSTGIVVGEVSKTSIVLYPDYPCYVLGVPVSHISALYCCGEVCK
jgi:hypothetical protein